MLFWRYVMTHEERSELRCLKEEKEKLSGPESQQHKAYDQNQKRALRISKIRFKPCQPPAQKMSKNFKKNVPSYSKARDIFLETDFGDFAQIPL
jgi:hypothetical protein